MKMYVFRCCTILLFSVTISIDCYNIHLFGRHFQEHYNNLMNQRLFRRMCFVYSEWFDCSLVRGFRMPRTRPHWSDGMNKIAPMFPIASSEAHVLTDTENTGRVYTLEFPQLEMNKGKTDLNLTVNKNNIKSVPVHVSPVQKTQTNILVNDDTETKNAEAGATTPANIAINNISTTLQPSTLPENEVVTKNLDNFMFALDRLERKFYSATFTRLLSISPPDRQENGMSFVQSGLFLQLVLLALSTEVDLDTKEEIDTSLGLRISDSEKIEVIREVLSLLPISSDDLKFRWSSRLVFSPHRNVSRQFVEGAASALRLHLGTFTGTETPEQRALLLNEMMERDSGGAIRNTFEEEELSEGVEAVQASTMYVRALWRAAPTVLNGTRPFRDAPAAPARAARMIRINDLMGYAHLPHWDAEAIEVSYSTSGLSLVLVVPRGRSLRRLARLAAEGGLRRACAAMTTLRVAATIPLYTLRMTLLLPNKLHEMGIVRLVNVTNSDKEHLKLSHAIQRIMFWAEAGRNAFKDDGIEWDEPPELELVIDRPYLFFVRWRNLTLMNGNFVL